MLVMNFLSMLLSYRPIKKEPGFTPGSFALQFYGPACEVPLWLFEVLSPLFAALPWLPDALL